MKASTLVLVITGATLLASGVSLAAAPAESQKPTTLTMSFTEAPTPSRQAPDSVGVRLKVGPDGGHHLRAPTERAVGLTITAQLSATDGTPAAFKPIAFSAKTSFGVVQFGSRPTDARGIARLSITDHRFGSYPVRAMYAGDEEFATASHETLVNGAPRPEPGLPKEGMLISPTATVWISLPFLFFFGAMWLAFAYSFGYLVLWRMRRSAS